MHETDLATFNLEEPSPGATLPAGRHRLRGWVLPRKDRHFVDVRARIAGLIFPGVHGLPRADLAAFFQTGRPYALAEFIVEVEFPPGPAEVVLEALDLAGRWQPFTRCTYNVTSAAPPDAPAAAPAPLHWQEFGRALHLLLREQRRQPDAPLEQLASAIVATIPHPRDLRHPHAPFRGHLDEPAAIVRAGFGRAPVLGYLVHAIAPIKRVLATFDLQLWQTVAHGRPSPRAAYLHPDLPGAGSSGFFGMIDLPSQLPDPVCLRLYAELEDGSLHLCSVARSRVVTHEDEKAPYPPHDDLTLARTIEAVKAALAARGVSVQADDELRREINRVAEDYRRRAPRSLPAPAPLQPAPAAPGAPARPPRRALFATHNLNLEGAPLFLADLARHYRGLGMQLTVVSETEGPLRSRFEEEGATVRVIDAKPLLKAAGADAARQALRRLGTELGAGAFELVVANTFTTFWAVHAARQAGRPALMYVHESTTPASFYRGQADAAVVALVEEAFSLAGRVSFTTASTRGYHLDYGRPENHRLTPGWIDVGRIDRWLAQNPREALRTRLGVKPDELLVTNIGTLCERKGQHIFIRAVDLLVRRHPELAARTRFIMLGGGRTPYDDSIADLLAHAGCRRLEVRPATIDYLPYYAAADLFVCSTYEESSPRVILEAMASRTPILSSVVQGISEQVRPDRDAQLVRAGDPDALAEGMAVLLLDPARRNTLARRARERVAAEFDAPRLLPRHAALACELAAPGPGQQPPPLLPDE